MTSRLQLVWQDLRLGRYFGVRAPGWSKFRAERIAEHPFCSACGGTNLLEAHHIEAFHRRPDRELDKSNICILCMDPKRQCHYREGHYGLSWLINNPHVVEDAANDLARMNEGLELLKMESWSPI